MNARENKNNKRVVAYLRSLAPQKLSLTDMAKQLNEEGFVTSTGKKFYPSQVKILLVRYEISYR